MVDNTKGLIVIETMLFLQTQTEWMVVDNYNVLTFLKNADNSSLYIDITLKVEGQI
jgi:hypothetical protein